MKKRTLDLLRIIFVCFSCAVIFIFTGYFYLTANLQNKRAETKTESIPYVPQKPENCGVLLNILGNAVLFYLDFESETLPVMIIDKQANLSDESFYGYPANYKINGDYTLVEAIIDRIDGIELEIDGEVLRYTGVQVADMLSRTNDNVLKRMVIESALEKISKTGFSKSDFVYIIENSETNLTIPVCYYWAEYMQNLCRESTIIN